MAISCSSCGRELPDDAKFCLQCGTKVAVAEADEEKPQRDVAILDKLLETALGWPTYLDFDKNKATIMDRAKQWAKYGISGLTMSEWANALSLDEVFLEGYAEVNWETEERFFKTNKPNAHKVLFIKTMVERLITEAWLRKYINADYTLSPVILATLRKMYPNWSDQDFQEYCQDLRFKKPEFSDLDKLATKDDELFPPPQPVRVEVAGAVLNFTTDEAVLVVYMDCTYAGREVEMQLDYGDDRYISPQHTKVVQRGTGNAAICASIFNNIPLVTDKLRHETKVLDRITCTVKCRAISVEEKVTLFKSNVTELDWRGRV